MQKISIEDKEISNNSSILLIAEVGVNHNGKIENAMKLIDHASRLNIDAIKFQTFHADKLILKNIGKAKYQKRNINDKESFYKMIKKYELTNKEFRLIKQYCDKKKIIFLSTPFDKQSVDLLEELDVSAYKIGSGDLDNYPLIRYICSKNKPILLSTGMSTLRDVKESLTFIKKNGIKKIVVLQCTSNYPAKFININLNVIDKYKQEFKNEIIGFSDHSIGIICSLGAAAKGAKVIEKHFTLNKSMEGPDHKASMNPKEMKDWSKKIRILELALGESKKEISNNEKGVLKIARKSIICASKLEKGTIIKEEDLVIKRPGTGISPRYFQDVVGRRTNKKLYKDSILKWDDFK
ncbi:MAG: N-acetylneuraminate synthase [Candidatus Lokiarchaeota archaeon]|nr:N-acetylneuraminate synthase [Candidatus Lokiarchaeota archaeon]